MSKKGFIPMRIRIAIMIAAAIMVNVTVLIFIGIYSLESAMEAQIKDRHMLLAKSFSEVVEQFFADARGMIRTAANLPAVKDVSAIQYFSEEVKGVPREVAVVKRETMNNIIANFGDFGYMQQVTTDGRNIAMEPYKQQLELTRTKFNDRDWFKGAVSKMDAHVSEVYISSSLQKPVVAVAHPVTDEQGRVQGVIFGGMILERLNELCRDLTFGETGYAYLVDQKGIVAAHRDSKYTETLTSVLEIPMVQKAMKGESGVGTFFDPLRNAEVISAYMPIGNSGWSIIVVQDPAEAFAVVENTRLVVIIIGIVLLLIAVATAYRLAKIMTDPINKIVTEIKKMREGDLTGEIKINSRDELAILANSFNESMVTLNQEMMNINNAAQQVAAGANQLAVSSQNLSQGATEQASSIEEVTSTMMQIAAQTKENAVDANKANELTLQAEEYAVQGNQQMREMAKAMAEINDAANNISKIIKVIDDLAFQTNILSLNAAVEAARAGQHGKGFAVVAEEVRNLAARSADAAQQTTGLIENSLRKTEIGTKMANNSAEELNRIEEAVKKAAELVGKIALASNEQATGIAQINQAIDQVSLVVQSNSATAEESAAASEELSSQAELLKNYVRKFKLKKNKSIFSVGNELNPEVVRMLEQMMEKENRTKFEGQPNTRETEKAEAEDGEEDFPAGNLSLDRDNFDKY